MIWLYCNHLTRVLQRASYRTSRRPITSSELQHYIRASNVLIHEFMLNNFHGTMSSFESARQFFSFFEIHRLACRGGVERELLEVLLFDGLQDQRIDDVTAIMRMKLVSPLDLLFFLGDK